MRQYVEQKAQVKDALLLFRMGDFYETFYDDAKTIARVLNLTLTARSKHADTPIPLAGVPYHSVDAYVAKLVRAGYKVAISEQIEDPKTAKGVVKRAVQRIITPGTLTDETLLDERAPNHLVALCPGGGNWKSGQVGLAIIELSSGRFVAEMLPAERLSDELSRVRPAEILVPESAIDVDQTSLEEIRESLGTVITARPAYVFSSHMAEQSLHKHFGVRSLSGFGFDAFDSSLAAAAALLDYLAETQRTALSHLTSLTPRHSDRCVMIDSVTLRSLEIERTLRDNAREGSLLHAVDLTVNAMGARRLREWLCFPLIEPIEIVSRQNAVAAFLSQPEKLRAVRDVLRSIGDVERIVARLGIGRATPRDVVVLGRALISCDRLAETIGPGLSPVSHDPSSQSGADLLSDIRARLMGLTSLGTYLTAALNDDAPPVLRDAGFIADGFSADLDRLRHIGADGQKWLAAYQARESERTGIPTLKVGFNSVFGYYIEITHQHRDKIPPEYVRKQTVRNAERYITEDLKRHEDEVLGAADRAKQLEYTLFDQIRAKAAESLMEIRGASDALAMLDVLASFAELARTRGYCRPELVADAESPEKTDARCSTPSPLLVFEDGRHPVLDLSERERFVPNDCELRPDGDRFIIITGPNMAGKSTYIRQVALLTLLAHTGSYVPARSMRWSPVDRIFARVGASDELSRGLSTFMVEMVETARILNNATPRSLVILDEIGRGTSTYDGLSIAWAITEHVAQRVRCRALFATHYHELTDLPGQIEGVANYNVAVHEQLRPDGTGRDVVFLHKIVRGAADRSYGVHVASMAGMPANIVKRAELLLEELERDHHIAGGRRKTGVRSRQADRSQLMLFDNASTSLPAWWRELVDAIGRVDVNQTTPLEALRILQTLKRIQSSSEGTID
ncbi:MAG: DNA mismatch repair protein MutS [Phycisphaerae bacterium]|nr:DNA mismatch repair protein MutS [Phycisphaerae bacterium]